MKTLALTLPNCRDEAKQIQYTKTFLSPWHLEDQFKKPVDVSWTETKQRAQRGTYVWILETEIIYRQSTKLPPHNNGKHMLLGSNVWHWGDEILF